MNGATRKDSQKNLDASTEQLAVITVSRETQKFKISRGNQQLVLNRSKQNKSPEGRASKKLEEV